MQRVDDRPRIVRERTDLDDEPLCRSARNCETTCASSSKRIQARPRCDGAVRHARPDRGDDARKRIGVLDGARWLQLGRRNQIYANPGGSYVASALGSPRINLCACGVAGGSRGGGDAGVVLRRSAEGEHCGCIRWRGYR